MATASWSLFGCVFFVSFKVYLLLSKYSLVNNLPYGTPNIVTVVQTDLLGLKKLT
ncbi:hypothetical protein RINTHH_14710 [Richelia intracellularis HH01]|uniref:Uncharacterized protein n=1 Tax=Richelia intracellularis HH01 TaxID=1165094 RepID=M1X5U8_9NOST|nr:hypothetical protein RINTHH_14710 [Richelia intracellularis HH01]